MGWRSIIVCQPAYLCLSHKRLQIKQADNEANIPLEDISAVVLDNPQIVLSQPLLCGLAHHGIAVLTVDEQHMPSGIFMPFLSYHRPLRRLQAQIGLSKPRMKRWHKQIVQQKIQNQSDTLTAVGRNRPVPALKRLTTLVRSGDPDNCEARAAAIYFRSLFGTPLYRGQTRFYNAALNYGYAVIRAAIARSLVGTGLHPSLGFFHRNELNPFNLVDDLIEPYRPLLDLWVCRQFPLEPDRELTPKDKACVVSVLHQDIGNTDNDDQSTILAHIEMMCQKLAVAIERGGAGSLWLAAHPPGRFVVEP